MKKNETKNNGHIESQDSVKRKNFSHAVNSVMNYFTYYPNLTKQEKLQILSFAMTAIKADKQSELIASTLYSDDQKQNSVPFPVNYYDEKGMEYDTYRDKESVSVSFSDCCFFPAPHSTKRLFTAVRNIINNSFGKNINHIGYYIPELKLCYVISGNHSIAAGIYTRKGEIDALVVNITPLFDHVDTDGAYWLNASKT